MSRRRPSGGGRGRDHSKGRGTSQGPRGPKSPPKVHDVPRDAVMVNGHSTTWLNQGFDWVYPNEVVGGALSLECGLDVERRVP